MQADELRLAALYEAFNARELDVVLRRLHPDVSWPNGWEGGALHGREAVRDYWIRQWCEIDPVLIPEGFLDLPDGRIRVKVCQVVRDLQGLVLSEARLEHVYRMLDAQVLSMEIRRQS